jgi:hypothetical protein
VFLLILKQIGYLSQYWFSWNSLAHLEVCNFKVSTSNFKYVSINPIIRDKVHNSSTYVINITPLNLEFSWKNVGFQWLSFILNFVENYYFFNFSSLLLLMIHIWKFVIFFHFSSLLLCFLAQDNCLKSSILSCMTRFISLASLFKELSPL